MLSTVGRAVARRTAITRIACSTPQFLSYHAPAVACYSIATRAFSVSAFARLPAAKAAPKAASKAISKKTNAAKKKKKTAVKPKRKPKSKPKSEPFPGKRLPLTPEQKEKLKIIEMKKWALLPSTAPANLPSSAWLLYVKQSVSPGEKDLPNRIKEISAAYKDLSPSKLEDLNKTADSNREINEANHRKWVESHSVGRIYVANMTRRELEKKSGKRIFPIRDHRVPQLPGNVFSHFIKTRFHDADVSAQEGIGKKVQFLANEWKTLSDAKKSPYEAEMKEVLDQYHAEMEKIKAEAAEIRAAFRDEKRAEKEAADAAEAAAKEAFRAEKKAVRDQANAEKEAAKEARRLAREAKL